MSTYIKSINFFKGKPENTEIELKDIPAEVAAIRHEFSKPEVKSVGIFHHDGKVFSYAHKVTGRRENFSEL